jgi:hypothetical protein
MAEFAGITIPTAPTLGDLYGNPAISPTPSETISAGDVKNKLDIILKVLQFVPFVIKQEQVLKVVAYVQAFLSQGWVLEMFTFLANLFNKNEAVVNFFKKTV